MNIKNIIYVVVIILMVFIASYLLTQRGVKSGEVCPAPVIKQNAQQAVPVAPKKTDISTIESKTAINGPKVTFIELGSVGCTPCNMMAPILDEIEKEYEGQVNVRFYDVNSLLGGPYGEKYRVQFIPTQVFLDEGGVEYYRHVGFFPKEEIVKILRLKGVK
jgi:thioredoxin 1